MNLSPGVTRMIQRLRQAVSKDLTSSSKFSGSCVLTIEEDERRVELNAVMG